MTLPPQDKLLHFLGGAFLSVCFGMAGFPVRGILVAVLVGALKEFYDYYHPESHTADIWDFVATALGGIAGFIARLSF